MKFKDLPLRHAFEFIRGPHSCGFPTGPWIKDSARKYHGHTLHCQVGSINVEVFDLGPSIEK